MTIMLNGSDLTVTPPTSPSLYTAAARHGAPVAPAPAALEAMRGTPLRLREP